jgi:hypothetical protein
LVPTRQFLATAHKFCFQGTEALLRGRTAIDRLLSLIGKGIALPCSRIYDTHLATVLQYHPETQPACNTPVLVLLV